MKKLNGIKASTIAISLFFGIPGISQAQITLGKDKGIFPTGIAINFKESGPLEASNATTETGIAAIGPYLRCARQTDLKEINGIWAVQIAPGIGLAPNATVRATYRGYDEDAHGFYDEVLTGVITPEGSRAATERGFRMESPGPTTTSHWCLAPTAKTVFGFFPNSGIKTVDITGEWMLVTDGTQRSGTARIPIMRAMSLGRSELYRDIIPAAIDIRVSTLECTISTPTVINFGAVEQNFTKNAELKKVVHNMNVACTQDSGKGIDTNINVRFKALSGLYEGNQHQLQLDQGGGYITGEIGGVTYTGRCGLNQGITFDNKAIKIGEIWSRQYNQTYNHQIGWRLCSGGSDLPSGRVTASAEMMVTYN